MSLKGKKIILGITGSIAAYKSAFLLRLLKKEGADIIVIMTASAKDFITPLTLSTLSENPVMCESFVALSGKWNSHVEFGEWADIMLIAPLSANTMAKMATGIADNLLLTTYLSSRSPVYFAPAMDKQMFQHPATQKNIEILKSFGNILIPPAQGELASGLSGYGRMQEPDAILDIIKSHFADKPLKKKKVLVTAGPTYEPIDAVRFIGNRSSGLMGFEIADAFADAGAEVTLISGPAKLETHNREIKRIDVITAKQMYHSCINNFPQADITIMSAAVADYFVKNPSDKKIKKEKKFLNLSLERNKDILLELGRKKRGNQILVGFALETDNEIINSTEKLKKKNLDLIVMNSLNDKGSGFEVPTNKVTIIDNKGRITDLPLMTKKEAAKKLLEIIIKSSKTKH